MWGAAARAPGSPGGYATQSLREWQCREDGQVLEGRGPKANGGLDRRLRLRLRRVRELRGGRRARGAEGEGGLRVCEGASLISNLASSPTTTGRAPCRASPIAASGNSTSSRCAGSPFLAAFSCTVGRTLASPGQPVAAAVGSTAANAASPTSAARLALPTAGTTAAGPVATAGATARKGANEPAVLLERSTEASAVLAAPGATKPTGRADGASLALAVLEAGRIGTLALRSTGPNATTASGATTVCACGVGTGFALPDGRGRSILQVLAVVATGALGRATSAVLKRCSTAAYRTSSCRRTGRSCNILASIMGATTTGLSRAEGRTSTTALRVSTLASAKRLVAGSVFGTCTFGASRLSSGSMPLRPALGMAAFGASAAARTAVTCGLATRLAVPSRSGPTARAATRTPVPATARAVTVVGDGVAGRLRQAISTTTRSPVAATRRGATSGIARRGANGTRGPSATPASSTSPAASSPKGRLVATGAAQGGLFSTGRGRTAARA